MRSSSSVQPNIPDVPRPCLRARLDHALELFHRGLAPVVITTGGAAADPTFSEGGVGRDYLMHHGVPERSLIAETQGRDTAESAMRVGVIMRANGLHSCVAVSDAYHVFRIRKLLEHEGIGPGLRRAAPGFAAAQRCGSARSRCCASRRVICCGGWELIEMNCFCGTRRGQISSCRYCWWCGS